MTDSDSNLSNAVKHTFPANIFSNPPPNQNPLIGSTHGDTLINVRDCLDLLSDLGFYEDNMITDGAVTGYYRLMGCVRSALVFEISHRDNIEAENNLDRFIEKAERRQKVHSRRDEQRKSVARKILELDDDEPDQTVDT